MSNDYSDLERARRRIDPAWGSRKIEEELGHLEARIEARKTRPLAPLFVIAASAACALLFLLTQRTDAPLEAGANTSRPLADRPAPPISAASPAEVAHVAPMVSAPTAPPDDSVVQATTDDAEPDEPPAVRRRSTRVKVAAAAWRSLAKEGRYHEAYRAMRGSEPDQSSGQVDELLLAGDAARLSGHAREAVPYYRAALDRAGASPRAHLAAFTLGRTLLNELSEPRAAAEAFARAYKASPRGPLAEEALAREVESWRRAGDLARAQEAVTRYQSAYPKGRLLKR